MKRFTRCAGWIVAARAPSVGAPAAWLKLQAALAAVLPQSVTPTERGNGES